MSDSYVSAPVRRQVRDRAGDSCEYCLLAQADAFFGHEPDHIVAMKHGGRGTVENLAWACLDCNRYKGSDIASLDPRSDALVPLFNPRLDRWREHFRLDGGRIRPLTSVGRATVRLMRLNAPQRLEVREALACAGRYPPVPAK